MDKKKLVFFLLFSVIYMVNLWGQRHDNNFENYQLKKKISVEDYLWDGNVFPPSTEIIGLFQFDHSTLLWVTLSGEIIFYDLDLEKIRIHDRLFNDHIITKASFNQATKKLFLCEKGKIISVCNLRNKSLESKTTLIDVSIQDTVTFNDFAINYSGNSVSTFSNDRIITWQLKNDVWEKKDIQRDKTPFSIEFLNDSIFLIGSHDGYGQLYNVENLRLIKSVKMFDSELSQCSVSKDKLRFVVTNQKEVKVYEKKFGYPRKIKSNFEFVGNIQWLDNNHILITGNGFGYEIWSNPKNRPPKLLVSQNVPKPKTRKSKKKPVFPNRESYLVLSDKDSMINLKKFNSNITAIDIGENYLATAEENFDLKIFQIKGNDLNLNEVMNCHENVGKSITDIQIRDSKSVYIGSLYSGGGFDLAKNEVHPFFTVNNWYSFDQIDFKSFKDVKIYKSDNGFEERKIAVISFNPYLDAGKRPSSLNKKIRKDGIRMRTLRNPSEFNISPEKKFLLTFDADGYLEMLNLKTYEIIFSNKINSFPIVGCEFLNEEELISIDALGNLSYYKVKDGKELVFVKKENLGIKPLKTDYNGIDLLVLSDNQKVTLYDLTNSKIVSTIKNKYKDFDISELKFIPKSENFIYVLNKKGRKKIDKGNNAEILNKNTKRTSASGISSHSILINQKMIVLGNSIGDIIFYQKRKK